MNSGARYSEEYYNNIKENKPKLKKEKTVYDKSKILELENKI